MRVQYTEELKNLNKQMIAMGSLCEEAITKIEHSLINADCEEAKQVRSIQEDILQDEKHIESLCLRLLLQQQPMAGDLRQISAALKMITDMKRIGEVAMDMGDIILYRKNFQRMKDIEDLAEKAVTMVHESVDAFVTRSLEKTQKVIAYDDIVDDLFLKVKYDLIEAIKKNPDGAEDYVDLLMIAKYFEKIGDHAVNISQWVAYSITGILKADAI